MNDFNKLYDEVFDNDKIRACGREKTKTLIASAMQLEPNTNFGNIKTGIMNVDAIKELHQHMMYEEK